MRLKTRLSAWGAGGALVGVALLLVLRGGPTGARAQPSGVGTAEAVAAPAAVGPSDGAHRSPEQRGEPQDLAGDRGGPTGPPDAAGREREARERLVAWALDAGGMVCSGSPDEYVTNFGNVRFCRTRGQLADKAAAGVCGPQLAADEWLARIPADVTLHAVDLRRSDVTARGLDFLAGREDLRVLVVWGGPPLRSDDLRVIATLPSLEVLVVVGAELDDHALTLASSARRRLELSGMGITDAGVPRLLGLEKLEHLELDNTSVSRRSLPLLVRLPALSKLSLPGMLALDRAALDAAR